MKVTFIFFTLLFLPSLGLGLTAEEYLSLAPELMATQSNTWLAIYTMCTGSLIAFYFFGWDSNWAVRIVGGIFVLGFVNQSLVQNEKTYHTEWESYILFLHENDICASETGLKYLHSAFDEDFCSEEMDHDQRVEILTNGLKNHGIIGSGWMKVDLGNSNTNGFELLLTGPLLSTFVVCFSFLIWFLLPSRRFFIKRGWIRE